MSEVYRIKYPFIRDKFEGFDEDGPCTSMTWKPGVRFENISYDEVGTFADAVGEQILTVVSRHKPSPKHPERVFYTQSFVAPDGRSFGKSGLKILTANAFRRRASGYRYAFDLDVGSNADE